MKNFTDISCRKDVNNIKKYLFILILYVFYSSMIFADEEDYGPRFELGVGGSLVMPQSMPEWSAEYYGSAILTSSFRFFEGLSIQGGRNIAFGGEPDTEWFDYGDHYQIESDKGTYIEGTWLGLRYDIPLRKYNLEFENIHTIYFGGGLLWDDYGIRSENQKYYIEEKAWEESGSPDEVNDSLHHFKFSELEGYYVTFAARWRVDTENAEKDSWIGAYGFDFGIRYSDYTKCSPEYENIVKSKSNFCNYQIFLVGFAKIRFFY